MRRARPSDREPLLEMSKGIWGGNDYLPLVWDRWLADERGVLLTAVLDGEPIGLSKVTVLAPGEVWLEGLRLNPDYQGRGLSHQINAATFRRAMRLKPRSVRYSTWIGNEASRHIAEANGFWQIARAEWMWARARRRGGLGSRPASGRDLDAVAGFVKRSECHRTMSGLIGIGWKFPALTRARLRDLISKEQVLLRPNRGRLTAVAIFGVGDIDGDMCLGFIDGPDEDITALSRDIRSIARVAGHEYASAMLPEGRIADAVYRAGFDAEEPFKAVVYELGPRGLSPRDEDFEESLWRTLRRSESKATDLLTDLLIADSGRALARENVRDFVSRNLIPDTPRWLMATTQRFIGRLRTNTLRTILRQIITHLHAAHGLSGAAMEVRTTGLTVRYRGRRLASIACNPRSIKLALGPGFGHCFPTKLDLPAHRIEFKAGSLDKKRRRHDAVSLVLTERAHIGGAKRAIDLIMKSATKME